MTDDLVAFLRARLDEDAAVAERNSHGRGLSEGYPQYPAFIDADTAAADEYVDRFCPARVLAEVDGKRRLLDYLVDLERKALDGNWWNLDTSQPIKLLALPYHGHPAYQPHWAPDADLR